jgi:hypothetical protein
MTFAVKSPRETRPDLEAFGLLAANARTALAEAGHGAFEGGSAAHRI